MKYTVILPRSVEKQLGRLPESIQSRLIAAFVKLEENPRPSDVKKLKGRDAWRTRVGEYRIIYEIRDKALQIIVIRVAHRRDAYRDSR